VCIGAPRLLQAIAADGVIPFINAFSVTNLKGEPRRALYLTATIAETGVLLANVDYIAPIITMYAMQDTFLLSLAGGLHFIRGHSYKLKVQRCRLSVRQKKFQSKSCECLEQTGCISCGGDLREYFQEEIGRMDRCGIISPVLLIHYCYKLQVTREKFRNRCMRSWNTLTNAGLFPFAARMLCCTQKIHDNELVGLLQQNKYKITVIIHS